MNKARFAILVVLAVTAGRGFAEDRSDTAAFTVEVQFYKFSDAAWDSTVGPLLGSTGGENADSSGPILLPLVVNLGPSPDSKASLGVRFGTLELNGVAIGKTPEVEVLANPVVATLPNQEAKIVIGSEVPEPEYLEPDPDAPGHFIRRTSHAEVGITVDIKVAQESDAGAVLHFVSRFARVTKRMPLEGTSPPVRLPVLETVEEKFQAYVPLAHRRTSVPELHDLAVEEKFEAHVPLALPDSAQQEAPPMEDVGITLPPGRWLGQASRIPGEGHLLLLARIYKRCGDRLTASEQSAPPQPRQFSAKLSVLEIHGRSRGAILSALKFDPDAPPGNEVSVFRAVDSGKTRQQRPIAGVGGLKDWLAGYKDVALLTAPRVTTLARDDARRVGRPLKMVTSNPAPQGRTATSFVDTLSQQSPFVSEWAKNMQPGAAIIADVATYPGPSGPTVNAGFIIGLSMNPAKTPGMIDVDMMYHRKRVVDSGNRMWPRRDVPPTFSDKEFQTKFAVKDGGWIGFTYPDQSQSDQVVILVAVEEVASQGQNDVESGGEAKSFGGGAGQTP